MTVQVWTIGHSNHSAGKFVELLQMHGINVLVDVRSKPVSRMPHFCRFNLIKLMNGAGIQYLYGGLALGGLSNYSTEDALFITKMDTTFFEHAQAGKRVAMMCSEGKPSECHRAGKLTAWLHRHRKLTATTHILPDGSTADARAYEPQVHKSVRWNMFDPWEQGLLSVLDE